MTARRDGKRAAVTWLKLTWLKPRPCAACGVVFRPHSHSRVKTCSKACWSELARRRALEQWARVDRGPPVCVVCGKDYSHRKDTRRRTCGRRCYDRLTGGQAAAVRAPDCRHCGVRAAQCRRRRNSKR
jgi:hypothetical protein